MGLQQWMDEGILPTFRKLAARGTFMRPRHRNDKTRLAAGLALPLSQSAPGSLAPVARSLATPRRSRHRRPVSGAHAYVVDSSSDDLKVIDVSDPSAPVLVGSIAVGGSPSAVFVS